MTKTLFAAALDQPFLLMDSASPVQLQLVECTALPVYPGAPARDPFQLLFRGPQSPVLPQRIYRLQNTAMGEIEIFLVPVGPDSQGMTYEAVFN